MRTLTALAVISLFLFPIKSWAGSGYDYQLYKNLENYGIVVFPKKHIYRELDDYFSSISFTKVESGKAIMRRGTKNENESLMMPLTVQRKHSIEKFIIIQVLGRDELLAGIYAPEWGLTLPSARYTLEALHQNIPQTLNIFRGNNLQRETRALFQEVLIFVSFFRQPDYNNVTVTEKTLPVQRLGGIGSNAGI